MERKNILYFMLLLPLLFPLTISAQQNNGFSLTADVKKKPVVLSNLKWKYLSGDDPSWADPRLDDRNWREINGTNFNKDNFPAKEWPNICWFRLKFQVDAALNNEPLILEVHHWGASEIYLDGKKVGGFGTVSGQKELEQPFDPNGLPVLVNFEDRPEHVIAVRYSCAHMADRQSLLYRLMVRREWNPEVGLVIWETKNYVNVVENQSRWEVGYRMGRCALYFAFGFLYLIIFFYYPVQRINLYFGLFGILCACNVYLSFLLILEHFQVGTRLLIDILSRLAAMCSWNSFLLFLYILLSPKIPKHFWGLVGLSILAVLSVDFGFFSQWIYLPVQTILGLEIFRLGALALRQRQNGRWVIGICALIYSFVPIKDVFFAYKLIPVWLAPIIVNFAALTTLITISVYLSRNLAIMNRDLSQQLEQVKTLSSLKLEQERRENELLRQKERHQEELTEAKLKAITAESQVKAAELQAQIIEAENSRKSEELAYARQMQLSLLPKADIKLAHCEIIGRMRTATEVGGDYYDFIKIDSDRYCLAVGDATGHGVGAGLIVGMVKSLLISSAQSPALATAAIGPAQSLMPNGDLHQIMLNINASLKASLAQRDIGMCLSLALFDAKSMTAEICTAGMPAPLWYRDNSDELVELKMAAPPLGFMKQIKLQSQRIKLAPGDSLIILSDGFHERMNGQKKIWTYRKMTQAVSQICQEKPAVTVVAERIFEACDQFSDGRINDDDMTALILKVNMF